MKNENSKPLEFNQDVVTPGEILAQQREEKGVDLSEVADSLKISVAYVQAIECSAFDQLPGLTFVRGYLRRYAEYVDLDANQVIQAFDRFIGSEAEANKLNTTNEVEPPDESNHPVFKWFTYLLIGVLVALTVLWWRNEANQPLAVNANSNLEEREITVETVTGETVVNVLAEAQQQEQQTVDVKPEAPITAVVEALAEQVLPEQDETQVLAVAEESEVSESVATTLVSQNSITTASTTDNSVQNSSTPPREISQNETTATAQLAPVTIEGVEGNHLIITFDGTCWTEVRDGKTGKALIKALYKEGSKLELTKVGPIKVKLGKASMVKSFQFNGGVIDVTPYTRGDVAKLVLGQE